MEKLCLHTAADSHCDNSVTVNGEDVFAYSGRSSTLMTVPLKMERMCLPTAADHPL